MLSPFLIRLRESVLDLLVCSAYLLAEVVSCSLFLVAFILGSSQLSADSFELSKQVRRSDKKIKDALSQADEERRQHDALKEQLEKLNSRLRASKRQADEAEEETARIQGLKRKVQRDLDEANETVESLQRELANQRNKARRDMRSRPLRDTFLTSRISSNEDLDDSGSTGVPAEGEAA